MASRVSNLDNPVLNGSKAACIGLCMCMCELLRRECRQLHIEDRLDNRWVTETNDLNGSLQYTAVPKNSACHSQSTGPHRFQSAGVSYRKQNLDDRLSHELGREEEQRPLLYPPIDNDSQRKRRAVLLSGHDTTWNS